VRTVVGDILFFFAAGKYPEAVGNAESAGDGGKIFRGGEGLGIKDAVGAEVGHKGFLKAFRGVLIVTGKRVGIVISKLGRLRTAGSLTLGIDNALDGAGDFIAYLLAIGAHIDLQVGLKGDDICFRAGVDGSHGQHAEFGRVELAGDDRLQTHDNGAGQYHGVNAEVRHGAMRALAINLDVHADCGGHERTGGQRHGAGGKVAGKDVLPKYYVGRGDLVHKSVIHHGLGTGGNLPRPAGK